MVESIGQLILKTRHYANALLKDYPHQSWPVPVQPQNGEKLCFMYCRAELTGPESGYQIWPPSHVMLMDAATGAFERITKVVPANFGVSCEMDKPLGPFLAPLEREREDHMVAMLNMFRLYDAVLPPFYQGIAASMAQHRNEFVDHFKQVSERPLMEFYRQLAPDFFRWLAHDD